jgi:hypothetical protein
MQIAHGSNRGKPGATVRYDAIAGSRSAWPDAIDPALALPSTGDRTMHINRLFRILACALPLALAACGSDRGPATDATVSGAQTAAAPATPPADAGAATTPTTPNAPTSPAPAALPTIESLLRPDDTLASAQARLGAGNVVVRELAGAEGATFPGWVLYPDDPERMAEAFLDEANAHPTMLRIGSPESVWQRADGIRIGLDTKALEALNGGPFTFSGFDWDYGGTVTDWRGGKLDPDDRPRGGQTLCPPENPPGNYPSGDAPFSSDDPIVRAHPAAICEFSVNIGD